jgi:MFS family permease
MPPGNRYLYVGSDLRSFQVMVVSRVVLWLVIGALVLSMSVVLTHFPKTRHPLTAVAAAVMFGGILAIAPDAAVLAGQFGIIAMVLVIVMISVRSLLAPSPSDRVFSSTRETRPSNQPSTRTVKKPTLPEPSGQASTQSLSPSPSEASS